MSGRFEGGGFRTGRGEALTLAWSPTPEGLRTLLGPSLAAGQSVVVEPGAGALEPAPVMLTLTDLRVPLDQGGDEGGDGDGDVATLAGLRGDAALGAPNLVFRDGTPGGTVVLGGLRGGATVRPGARPELTLEAELSGPGVRPGPLRVRASGLTPLGAGEGSGSQVELELAGTGVPTPLVDALAGADGLLTDVFGPRVDVTAESPALGVRDGTLRAALTSPRASSTFAGRLAEGVLTTAADGGLDATLGLSPLFSERVVGPLLPLVVDVRKPDGAEPCAFRVRDVAFPLDGDLAALDAVVELELGEVVYRLLPGLQPSFLGDLVELRATRVDPLVVRIERGVAHYDGLPVTVDGRDIGFRGSYGLVDDALALEADVPFTALGDDLAAKVGRYVGDGTTVPVRIGGTARRPTVAVSADDVLERAAGGLLERLLRPR